MTKQRSNKMTGREIEDGGWAWVILLMNSLCHVIEGTIVISTGLYQVEFLKLFSSSTSVASLPSSILLSLELLLGPIAGALSTIFGSRQIIIFGAVLFSVGLLSTSMMTELSHIVITYGICAGTGFGLCYTPFTAVLGHYFVKKRGLANGIALAATGLGHAVGPYMIIFLIENYGWRLALFVEACMTLQICVAASTFYPSKADTAKKRNRKTSFGCSNIKNCAADLWYLKQPKLWILCLGYGFQNVGWGVHAVHFPGFAESQGIDPQSLSHMFVAFGLTVAVSRFLCGVLCNDASVSMVAVLFGTQGCQGIVTLLMPLYAKTYAGCMAYQILMSFFFGAAFVPMTSLAAEVCCVTNLESAFGWIMTFGGLSCIIGPVFAGWLHDLTGNYSSGFFAAGALEIAASLLALLFPLCGKSDGATDTDHEEKSFRDLENVLDIELPEHLPAERDGYSGSTQFP